MREHLKENIHLLAEYNRVTGPLNIIGPRSLLVQMYPSLTQWGKWDCFRSYEWKTVQRWGFGTQSGRVLILEKSPEPRIQREESFRSQNTESRKNWEEQSFRAEMCLKDGEWFPQWSVEPDQAGENRRQLGSWRVTYKVPQGQESWQQPREMPAGSLSWRSEARRPKGWQIMWGSEPNGVSGQEMEPCWEGNKVKKHPSWRGWSKVWWGMPELYWGLVRDAGAVLGVGGHLELERLNYCLNSPGEFWVIVVGLSWLSCMEFF